MTSPNPYAAPHAAPQGTGLADYVPLGWRTTMATLSVAFLTAASLTMHGMQVTFGQATLDPKALAILLVTGFAGLAILVMQVSSAVFVLMWVYRASRNLRGLGRIGMRATPAGCVVGFFIPIASLWLPFAAMKEIWLASDPQATQGTWFSSKGTPLLGIWWASYLVTSFLGVGAFFARSEPSAEGAIGLAADLPRVLAAVTLVLLLRGIEARQEQATRGDGYPFDAGNRIASEN